jgi:leader peptidase (prepilin peptidase)/N-methyltransferase
VGPSVGVDASTHFARRALAQRVRSLYVSLGDAAWPVAYAGSGVVGAAASSGLAGDVVTVLRTDAVRQVSGSGWPPSSWWSFWESSRITPRRLIAGSGVHSYAFEMSRSRSMLHLATCERMMGRPGAVCSLSGVPTARGALASAFALAGLICAPGLMLVEIAGADGNLFACLALLAVVLAMVGAGIASCVRRIFDANRWGGVGTRLTVVANVAVSERGVGLGRTLLTEIARLADDDGRTLVLTVRTDNVAATRLYRSVGFTDEPSVKVRSGQIAMIRRSPSAVRSARPWDEHLAGALVVGCAVSVVAVLVGATTVSGPTRIAVASGLCVLCAATIVDVRAFRLPNRFLLVAAVLAALAAYFGGAVDSALAASVMGAAPFLLVHLADPSALGFGDVKFAAVAGALIAPWWWPGAVLMAVVALAVACAMRLARPSGPHALGPSLFIGTLVALLVSIVLVQKGLVA